MTKIAAGRRKAGNGKMNSWADGNQICPNGTTRATLTDKQGHPIAKECAGEDDEQEPDSEDEG